MKNLVLALVIAGSLCGVATVVEAGRCNKKCSETCSKKRCDSDCKQSCNSCE